MTYPLSQIETMVNTITSDNPPVKTCYPLSPLEKMRENNFQWNIAISWSDSASSSGWFAFLPTKEDKDFQISEHELRCMIQKVKQTKESFIHIYINDSTPNQIFCWEIDRVSNEWSLQIPIGV